MSWSVTPSIAATVRCFANPGSPRPSARPRRRAARRPWGRRRARCRGRYASTTPPPCQAERLHKGSALRIRRRRSQAVTQEQDHDPPEIAPHDACVSCFKGDTTTAFAVAGEPEFAIAYIAHLVAIPLDHAWARVHLWRREEAGSPLGKVPSHYV